MNSCNFQYKRAVQTSHKGIFNALLTIPEWNRIVIGDVKDGSISLWDTSVFEKIDHIKAHKEGITSFCFIKEKGLLVSASRDTTIQVRKITEHKVEKLSIELSAHSDTVRNILYSKKNNVIISGGEDADLKIWDGDNFSLKGKIKTFRGGMGMSMVLLEDENLVGVGFTDGYIDFFSLASGKLVQRINTGNSNNHINCLTVLNNKKLLVSIVGHDCIKIWSLASKKPKLIKEIKSLGLSFVSNFITFENNKILVIPVNHQSLKSLNIYSGKLHNELTMKTYINFLTYNEALDLIIGFHFRTGILSLIRYH